MYEPSLNYEEASAACRDMHRQLLVPKSEAEQNTAVYIKDLSMLGISDEQTEGKWIDSEQNPLGDFNKWAKGEPNTASYDCAQLRKAGWIDHQCATKLNYICEDTGNSCPETHPWAFSGGKKCCQTSNEGKKVSIKDLFRKVWDPKEKNCDGGQISYFSECCLDADGAESDGITCKSPPCVNHDSVLLGKLVGMNCTFL